MSKFKGKLARRIMAVVLSGAMVMSNMSVYAAELAPEKETELVSEAEEIDIDAADAADDTDVSENDGVDSESADKSTKETEDADGDEGNTGDNSEDTTGNTDNGDGEEGGEGEGGDTQEATLDAPTNLKAEKSEDGNSVVISWTAVTVPEGYEGVTYAVTAKAGDTEVSLSDADKLSGTSFTVALSGLTKGTTYTFAVKATAKKSGENEPDSITSEEATATFEYKEEASETVTVGKPANLSVASENGKLIFKWDAVTVEGYTVSYDVTAAKKNDSSSNKIEKSNLTANQVEITETLDAGAEYVFSVLAKVTKDDTEIKSEAAETNYIVPNASTGENEKHTFQSDFADEVFVADHNPDKSSSGVKLPAGTLFGTDLYFKVKAVKVEDPSGVAGADGNLAVADGSANYKFQSKNHVMDLSKWGSSGIEFTVEGTADVTIEASSTGGSNVSRIALYNSSDEAQAAEFTAGDNISSDNDKKVIWLKTNTKQTFTYTSLSAGTYTLLCPYVEIPEGAAAEEKADIAATNGRGARVWSVKVEETSNRQARAAFSNVALPEVTSAALNADDETKIDVNVTGLVGYDGADKVTLVLTDASGEVGKEVSRVGGNTHSFSIKPADTAAGTITVKAVLSRGTDEKVGTVTKEVEYNAPVKAPEQTSLKVTDKTEGDNVALEFSWGAAAKATSYNVTVTEDAEGAEPIFDQKKIVDTKVTINEGLEKGKTYVFSVASVKSAEGAEDEVSADAATTKYKIPAPASSGTVTTTYKFDATTLTATKDEEEISAGTTLGDEGYFKAWTIKLADLGDSGDLVGTVKKRINKNTGAVTSVQVEKCLSAGIQFTVTGTADVTISMCSTGGSNSSPVGLVGADDKVISNNENLTTVTGTSGTELHYVDLPAGTYRVVSPGTKDDGMNRGARIYTIEVKETTAGGGLTETEYTYDATKLPVGKDKDEIPAGEILFDYFKVMTYTVEGANADGTAVKGTVIKRNKSDNTAVSSTEVSKYLSSAIQFTVTGTADVVIEMSSTGGTNTSVVGLVDADDKIVPEESTPTVTTITGTGKKEMKYTGLTAGTYRVASPGTPGDGMDRGARLYTIKVKEITGGTRPPRADWATVAAPEITSVELDAANANKVNVNVSALLGYDGGDKVTVTMKDAEGNVIGEDSSGNDGAAHIISFTPEGSGTYTFTATLERRNEEDKTSAEAKEFSFTLPLTIPYIKSATSKGRVAGTDSGSVELAWDEVKEATGYTLKYKEKDAADDTAQTKEFDKDTFECLIQEGLTIGKEYVFTMTAKRAGTGPDGADEVTAASDESLVEITEESQMTWAFSVYGDSTSVNTNGYTDKKKTSGQNAGKDMPLGEVNQIGGEAKFEEHDNDFVRVWSMSGAGKIVPASVDGIAFYYTKINPDTTNFKLTATAHVNEWTLSNGQDGFGIMAADRVGKHGDSGKWWNNSYQALASKVEWRWNPDKEIPDTTGNDDYPRYAMKLGVGSTEKIGVTKENLPELEDTDTVSDATKKYFKSDTRTLDISTIDLPAGDYNIIGNYTGGTPKGTQTKLLVTDLRLTIELNATGYFLTYTPIYADGKEGATITNKYYDRKALSHIEENAVYVGFFASRNADVTFKDVALETRAYDPAEAPETRPVEKLIPAYSVSSGSTANSAKYDLLFSANWPGRLTVKDSKGSTIIAPNKDENGKELNNVTVDEYGVIDTFKSPEPIELGIGVNTFDWTFTPDESYIYDANPAYKDDGSTPNEPRSFTELSDYAAQIGTFTVTYKTYGNTGEALYVSPKGTAAGTGTKANPLDIYTAVKYAQSGQTIYLMEGTYNLSKTVTIAKGINGTVDVEYETDADGNIVYDNYNFKKVKSYDVKEYIYMLPDPNAKTRPVLDFGRMCEGFVAAGDAWYIKGIDVTRSQLGKDGMRVCGSYCVVEDVHTYNNGNTGIQISRFGSDSKDFWPSYNLILNCTSYLNADQGFEDADGFAAKLTIGQGNVFDGCIAAYNADDGWDLFAKVESGNIGRVVIKNSIAYRNGYVLVRDPNGDGRITNDEARDANRVLALDGVEYPAGNGNGFKMGGSNLPGGHTLYNSAAFYNAAKGIDSNSCVDIKAYNSISFNNEAYNVAFYGTASNTNFASAGVISYRTDEEYDVWEKQEDGTQVKSGTKSYLKEIKKGITYAAVKDQFDPSGEQKKDTSAVKNETTYLYEEGADKSTNSKGEAVSADWFVKADNASFAEFDKAMKADMNYARVDGRVNLHGFLELTDKVGTAAGEGNTGLGGAPSEEKDKLKPIPTDVPTTGGDISSGDAPPEEEASAVRPEDMDKFMEIAAKSENIETIGLWFNIVDSQDVYYTGKAVKPEIHVYSGRTLLTKKDYTVTYKNNVNAYVGAGTCSNKADEAALKKAYSSIEKKPTIIVKGKGNYINAAAEQYFDIHPVDFANSPADPSKPYIVVRDVAVETGKTGKAAPIVTYNGKKLAKNKDYVDITETPSATKELTLKAVEGGNYTGETKFWYKVVDKSKLAKSFKISPIPEQQRKGYNNYDVKDPIPVTLDDLLTKKEITVTADKELTFGTDYTVVYENNIEVGTATAVFVGQGDYAGTKEVKFKIVAQDFNRLIKDGRLKVLENGKDITATKKLDEENYEGAAIRKNNISVKDGDITLELDKDYTLAYKGNNKAGNTSIVIKGIGNYRGNITKSFRINPLDLSALPSNIEIGGTFASDYKLTANYEKGGSKPSVQLLIKVKDKDGTVLQTNRMIPGKDYSVAYKKNTAVGEGTITLTGKGGLKGKLSDKPFTIVKKSLSDPDIQIMAEDFAVSKAEKDAALSAKITILDANGKKLSAGADYDKVITYEKVSGEGTVTPSGNKTTVSIKSESDVLTIKATIKAAETDKCGYTGTVSTTFRVGYARQSIKSARVTVNYKNNKDGREFKYFDYTGEEIRLKQDNLEVIVNGETLTYGTDFTIMTAPDYIETYKNNIKKGTASVTIIGIGKYTGTRVVKYSIGAKYFSWDDVAAKLNNLLQR